MIPDQADTSINRPRRGAPVGSTVIVPAELQAVVADVIVRATGNETPVVITGWTESLQVLRHRDLRQGLYDEGRALMEHVIVNLHGPAHTSRRRLENRLFRRDTFVTWERETIPSIIASMLDAHLSAGHVDLIPFARKVMMRLAVDVAGVDLDSGSDAEFDDLYELMGRLARASNVASAAGPPEDAIADGNRALAEFRERFYVRSHDRRHELLRRFEMGEISEDDLPRDVLITLLRNHDRLELPADVVIREVAYYPWVGSHSTSNAFVHAMHHILDSIGSDPELRGRLLDEPFLLQAHVHEALRLHPASPITKRRAVDNVDLPSGRHIEAGTVVIVNMIAANRDPRVFGSDANDFRPGRQVTGDVTAWGLTFGSGFHACLGQELAGGLEPDADTKPDSHLYGAISVLAATLLRHFALPDPNEPALRDPHSIRPNWGTYPVVFAR